jgi:hypothetical protein
VLAEKQMKGDTKRERNLKVKEDDDPSRQTGEKNRPSQFLDAEHVRSVDQQRTF